MAMTKRETIEEVRRVIEGDCSMGDGPIRRQLYDRGLITLEGLRSTGWNRDDLERPDLLTAVCRALLG